MQNSCTNTRLNIWTVAIVVTKFLWMFHYVIWLLHALYSITIECYVLYWIRMHYTVLLNLCHDLALVLEQFGMMCCLFENWCCFNLNGLKCKWKLALLHQMKLIPMLFIFFQFSYIYKFNLYVYILINY